MLVEAMAVGNIQRSASGTVEGSQAMLTVIVAEIIVQLGQQLGLVASARPRKAEALVRTSHCVWRVW